MGIIAYVQMADEYVAHTAHLHGDIRMQWTVCGEPVRAHHYQRTSVTCLRCIAVEARIDATLATIKRLGLLVDDSTSSA